MKSSVRQLRPDIVKSRSYSVISRYARITEKDRIAAVFRETHPVADEEIRKYADSFTDFPTIVQVIYDRVKQDLPENLLVVAQARVAIGGMVEMKLRAKCRDGVLVYEKSSGSRGGTYNWAPGCGPVAVVPIRSRSVTEYQPTSSSSLERRVDRLETEVSEIKTDIKKIISKLGA